MVPENRLPGLRGRGQKKWQSCKDSNLNKVNQNHLCYRYTTGLHIISIAFFNIAAVLAKARAGAEKNSFLRKIPERWELPLLFAAGFGGISAGTAIGPV